MLTNVPLPLPATVGRARRNPAARTAALRRWLGAHLTAPAPTLCPASEWAHRWDASWGAVCCTACGAHTLLEHRR